MDGRAPDPRRDDVRHYSGLRARVTMPRMTAVSPALLITITVLVLLAVALGTLAARLFMAASRSSRQGPPGPRG